MLVMLHKRNVGLLENSTIPSLRVQGARRCVFLQNNGDCLSRVRETAHMSEV